MTLVDMKQNKNYQISKISTNDNILRERLVSLGICEGAEASLLEKSLDRSTIAIISNNTRIALRTSEAREVIVKEL
ncbi:MAG: ferrous iron transport protein A [Helicobacteraceae bacterium]|nr:ferrous iron transport protein A [Helicobacteraceae bacterium]